MKMGIAEGAWASLPPDLLVDILRRLGTTAVIRSAAACKPWRRAIITNASGLRPRPDRYHPNLLVGFLYHIKDDAVVDDAGTWGPVQRSEEVDMGVGLRTFGMYGKSTVVVAHDAVYWLAGPQSRWTITCTVGLDMCTGRAWVTALPSQYQFVEDSLTLYTLIMTGDGRLGLLQSVPHPHIDLWVLDGDRGATEWTVQHKISIHVCHPGDGIMGKLDSVIICPRSGFLILGMCSGPVVRVNLDSGARNPVLHMGSRDLLYEYIPYEMDWSTYISNMKNFDVKLGNRQALQLGDVKKRRKVSISEDMPHEDRLCCNRRITRSMKCSPK